MQNWFGSISLFVFGIIRGNELHSSGKDREVFYLLGENALSKNLCHIAFYIRKTMLHAKIVQMKISKMSIVICSNLNTKQEQCIRTVYKYSPVLCCIQSAMLETGICGMPILL